MNGLQNQSYPNDLISEVLELHQEIKKEFIKEFGQKKIGDNSCTLRWLERRDNNQIKNILKKISNYITQNDDLKTNYRILREIYAISPSFHEIWFFKTHLESDFNRLVNGMGGIKACFTSIENDNLRDGNLIRITTIILKQTILIENLLSSKLTKKFIYYLNQPSRNIKHDLEKLKELNQSKDVDVYSVMKIMPILYGVVHNLLKKSDYIQLKSGSLLQKWLKFAPCSINEGPIFVPKTNKDLVNIFASIPSLEQKVIKNHLRKHFVVKEIK